MLHISNCFTLVLLFGIRVSNHCAASDSADGRHSFSLTTFDPSGKLNQVERSSDASAKGTPVIAILRHDTILMASPQVCPSAFIEDDGTARFVRITPDIIVSHSGLSADGRVLVQIAQRVAVQHKYTFDENIQIDILLEEISLLFQEYTIKAAARPFGCTLIVAHLPSIGDHDLGVKPAIYQVDPSGAIQRLAADGAIVNGNLERTSLQSALSKMTMKKSSGIDEDQSTLAALLYEALKELAPKERNQSSPPSMTILTSALSRTDHFSISRHTQPME
jgi:20S proteasome alpha/beta subunit